jgi:hypothetical protein
MQVNHISDERSYGAINLYGGVQIGERDLVHCYFARKRVIACKLASSFFQSDCVI